MRWARLVALAAATWLALVGAGCHTPFDFASSSCFGGILNQPPGPGEAYIDPNFALIFLDGLTRTDTLTACFLGGPADRAAVTWSSLDPSIATVEPATGPETTVTGHRFGRTRVIAVMRGLRREVSAIVCNRPGDCPEP